MKGRMAGNYRQLPQTVSSEMAKFEAADPPTGVIITVMLSLNVDPRGNSEGDVNLWGIEDGRRRLWLCWKRIAKQPWCKTERHLSWQFRRVCMVVWRIAAQQPPHFTAAWEGTGNMYTESNLSTVYLGLVLRMASPLHACKIDWRLEYAFSIHIMMLIGAVKQSVWENIKSSGLCMRRYVISI